MRGVLADGLSIWLSEGGGQPATLESLRQHEMVVRHALITATPLPLRYGTAFRTEQAARAALHARHEEFTTILHQVRDQVEMSVRVSLIHDTFEPPATREATHGASTPGRRHLERRRAELAATEHANARADAVLANLEQELADLRLPSARRPDPRGDAVGSLAHLVHKEGLRPYRARIASLRDERPDLRLALSGPWAPYSFV